MSEGGSWKQGICGICPAGCWVEVQTQDGRLFGIRPDSSHPLGMICRRGEHAPEIVNSEHRLRSPLIRTGPKGRHEFREATWDEAYERIVSELQQIREESGPEAAAIYTGRGAFELSLCDIFQPRGVAVSSASSVLFPFGSPNTMGVGALCYVSFAMMAPDVTMGRMLINIYTDLENAERVVVWGANPATDSPPLDMHRLEAAAQRGADIVVIDPRRTETVDRTGARWIPIRPGTDGALALALMEVLLEEDLHDEDLVENFCHGVPELSRYVQHFTPEKAEAITGVPAETIRQLARDLALANGCAPVMYTGLEYSNSGIQAIRAVFILWAMAGQLDVPGGLGLAMAGTHFPINRSCNVPNPDLDRAVARDRFPLYSQYRGESHASGLVDSVLKGDPYRIRALLIHGASLLTSWPETRIWRETLSKLDFLVSIDRQLTADAAYADVVLPATTGFEIDSYMVYGPIFRLREKLVEPVGQARNDYRIMTELAERLGYGDLYPRTEEDMIRFVLEGSGFTLEEIRAAGGWVKIASPVMEYRKWEKGSLRADGKPGFETPTGKLEIYSTILEDFGYEPLPTYTEPVEGPLSRPDLALEYPLVFNSGARPQTDFRSQHHGIKGLSKDHPDPTVEIHPDDAAARDIETGDLVEVRTPRGGVSFRARVTGDITQGAVECSMGGGGPVGPKSWQSSNVNELTDLANADEISGFPVYKCLLCNVIKLEEGDEKSRKSAGNVARSCVAGSGGLVARPQRRRIYLDHNATTPVEPEVREAMLPFFGEGAANPSSLHASGRQARSAMEGARRQVAGLLGARPRGLVFTGGGSEANNLALKGVAFARQERGGHIVTTAVEHPAILATCRFLEEMGFRVSYVGVDNDGLVCPEALERLLSQETFLVSVMLANNEVGTIQRIRELAELTRKRRILFHTDAVQGVGKITVDLDDLGVDLASISGHKLGGPKGVGALFVRKGLDLVPLIHGGKQEGGRRAGTENVAAIVGLGRAAELARSRLAQGQGVERLRDRLERGIQDLRPDMMRNGPKEERLPNTLNVTLPGVRGESLAVALDQHGISISAGSACKTGAPEPTHVLLAMGRSEEDAHCSIRFSLGPGTTDEEIDFTLKALARVLDEMENTVRFLPCK